jgi:hypothetical protein
MSNTCVPRAVAAVQVDLVVVVFRAGAGMWPAGRVGDGQGRRRPDPVDLVVVAGATSYQALV